MYVSPKPKIIYLQDLINSPEFQNTNAEMPIIFGCDTNKNIVVQDLTTIPHLLIGGKTGSGKTMFLQTVLYSLSAKLTPKQCRFIIFDTKNYGYKNWNTDKHMFVPVITNTDQIIPMFNKILEMIDSRYETFTAANVNNIREYNALGNNMPMMVVIIDEFADFMGLAPNDTTNFVQTVCAKARATGIHLLVATQMLTADVLSNAILSCFPARVAFNTRTTAESVQLLGEPGAQRLLPFGDILYADAGRYPIQIQTPYPEI